MEQKVIRPTKPGVFPVLEEGFHDIALGNIIGSNIFNVFLILGVSATISPLYPTGLTTVDFAVCIGASTRATISAASMSQSTVFCGGVTVNFAECSGFHE